MSLSKQRKRPIYIEDDDNNKKKKKPIHIADTYPDESSIIDLHACCQVPYCENEASQYLICPHFICQECCLFLVPDNDPNNEGGYEMIRKCPICNHTGPWRDSLDEYHEFNSYGRPAYRMGMFNTEGILMQRIDQDEDEDERVASALNNTEENEQEREEQEDDFDDNVPPIEIEQIQGDTIKVVRHPQIQRIYKDRLGYFDPDMDRGNHLLRMKKNYYQIFLQIHGLPPIHGLSPIHGEDDDSDYE